MNVIDRDDAGRIGRRSGEVGTQRIARREIEIGRGTVEVDGVSYSTNLLRGQFPTGTGAPVAIPIDPREFVVGVRQDVSWKILDPIEEFWAKQSGKVEQYRPGTWGPASADKMLAQDGREWRIP